MRGIDAHTRLCAVIGNPVGHSLSPTIHNAAFEVLALNYVYLAFEVSDPAGCLAGMRALHGFRGMSVTIPHKLAVMKHLDEIDPLARKVGSVNTITNEDGRLIGSSTDGPGVIRALKEAGVDCSGRRVTFFGAGGAVRAVAFALADEGRVSHITLLGRSEPRVESLARDLRAGTACAVDVGRLDGGVATAVAASDILVHGTPLGMYPDYEGESCIPGQALQSRHVVFDMVYRPLQTRLVREAEAAGCTVVRGSEMLIHQAALQFERWTGHNAPLDIMRRALYAALV